MKIKFIVFLLFCSSIVSAQFNVGPVIGLNNTRYVYKSATRFFPKDRFDVVPDFRLGVLARLRLNSNWSLQPALMYARNGERSTEAYQSRTVGFHLNTLEMPLTLVLKPVNHRIFVGGGLVPILVLGGRAKMSNYNSSGFVNQTNEPIVNGYSLFAVAVRGEVGYEMKHGLSLRMYAQKELTNMLSEEAYPITILTCFNYGIGASYFFGYGTHAKANKNRESRLERKKKMVRTAPRFRK